MGYSPNTNSLYTTIRNTSGSSLVFGFLGPRGMRLAANESVTVPGNLPNALGASLYQRKFKSFEKALDTGLLAIVSTPAVFLFDRVRDQTRQLGLENHVLGTYDPSYYSSSLAFSGA